jgi:hypothetical protein
MSADWNVTRCGELEWPARKRKGTADVSSSRRLWDSRYLEGDLIIRNFSMRVKQDMACVRDGKAWQNMSSGSVTRLMRARDVKA